MRPRRTIRLHRRGWAAALRRPARALEVMTQLPVAAAAYLHTLPVSRFVAVPETTHYIQTERPDVVIAAVKDAVGGTILQSTPTRP